MFEEPLVSAEELRAARDLESSRELFVRLVAVGHLPEDRYVGVLDILGAERMHYEISTDVEETDQGLFAVLRVTVTADNGADRAAVQDAFRALSVRRTASSELASARQFTMRLADLP